MTLNTLNMYPALLAHMQGWPKSGFFYKKNAGLVFFGFYWVLLGFFGFYWVLLGFIDFSPSNYRVLLGFIGFYWVFSRSWTSFGMFLIFGLLSYFWFYPFSIPGFKVFYGVLLGFIGFLAFFWMILGLFSKKTQKNRFWWGFLTGFFWFFLGGFFWVGFFWPSLPLGC